VEQIKVGMARGRPVGGGVAVGCGVGGVLPRRLPLHLRWRCIADKKIRREGCDTMYFLPPRKRPVGARVPGSSKSVMMSAIS
jgi:hypothetical protein